VPHHGEAQSLPAGLLRLVQAPQIVLSASADVDKQPAEDVAGMLTRIGSRLLCTQHAPGAAFCANPRCDAAHGGQNVVFSWVRNDGVCVTSACACTPPAGRA